MNEIFARNIVNKLQKWLKRKEIFAIKGPRQAGKTTVMNLLKEHLIKSKVKEKNIVFISCDDYDVVEQFNDPKAFVKSYVRDKEKYYFFLDEYQYIRDGGRKLKLLYDSFPNIKFIISGSSSLELTDKTTKYLVGRVFSFMLPTFSFWEFLNARDERLATIHKEMNKAINNFLLKGKNFKIKKDIFLKEITRLFEEYAIFGGYPEVIKGKDIETKKIILKNIYDTYLNKDIVDLLKITDVMKFRHIVGLLAAQHSGILNFESIASDAKSYYREVKRFVSILEETYILRLLQPFHKNLSTELRKNPKMYFLDSGMRNYIVKNFNTLNVRDDKGKLIEGIVLSSFINSKIDAEIKYWRTLAKAEVDFVLCTDEAIPIEVKYSRFTKPEINRSMRSFIKSYKPKKALVITKDYWGTLKIGKTTIKFVPVCYL